MAEIYFCPNCMEEITGEVSTCPKCGLDTRIQNKPHQLPVYSIIGGRYMVGKTLGAGGFGITYVGYDLKMDSKVAIKEFFMSGVVNREYSLTVIPTEEKSKATFTKGKTRFLDEAQILAQFVDEPGIVNVRDYFEENGTAYIIMAFLEGQDLRAYAKEHGKLSFDEALELLEPAMLALDKVHKKGLIHRDISPANLMLLKDGSVKVLDFGTARAQSLMGEKSLSVMLKPGFAPEEQYRTHGEQGPWTDMYAMCATFYRLITGETPPPSTDRTFEDSIKLPSELGAKITAKQEAVLMKGLAVKSAERIQSMDELIKCMKGEQKLKVKLPWKKIGLAAAAAVVAVGIFAFTKFAGNDADSGVLPAAAETDGVSQEPIEYEWVMKSKYMMTEKMLIEANGDIYQIERNEYDEYGRTLKTTTASYFEGEYLSSYYNAWEYDEDGFSTYYEFGHIPDDGQSRKLYYAAEYNEQEGREVRSEYDEEGNLKGWIFSEENEEGQNINYLYNPDGSLASYSFSIFTELDSGLKIDFYVYDGEGNQTQQTISIYDDNDNLLSEEMYYEGELSYREEYSYDEDGRIVSGTYRSYYSDTETIYDVSAEYELMDILVRQEVEK